MESDLWIFFLIGFCAQIIDGALGMAYGVTATTFLISFGTPPAVASASVHLAEVFTTGASGASHLLLKNVDRRLFRQLAVAGAGGAIVGAYFLTTLPVRPVRVLVAAYLAVMGCLILFKATRRNLQARPVQRLQTGILGLLGGFFDALGGGGWGPIVTSSLVARGQSPRLAIGSANLAEFFVAASASCTFLLTIGLGYWQAVLGLVAGGVFAAPLGAWLCRWLPVRVLMYLVGGLICLLSLRALAHVFLLPP
ncbi:UPF0721 transmembrane protein [Desulfuromonas versatilis]|uniref:Probable membrane transporter protein n=1 Tax=Desulfuromonas versatilis TaxID=2802975 RepID=A0ABM8HUH9_9BACT|nr:sulfite exporter TauE/SafE family protein [Desulfuromonas versatilis]BCR05631.1 UPF0721 transmembrane protein [Desulfuromonas versatilis]